MGGAEQQSEGGTVKVLLNSPEYLEWLIFSATFRSEAEEKFKVNLKSVPSNERSDISRTIIRGQFLSRQSRRLIK